MARVERPLASAVKVVEAGNRVVLDKRPGHSFIENEVTGERIGLKIRKGSFVMDVMYADRSMGEITLDSGAGGSVWPEHLQREVRMGPAEKGLRMKAANGTPIESLGTKVIKFKGEKCNAVGFAGRS